MTDDLVQRLATAIKKSIGKQFNATPIHPNPSVEDWTASGGVLDLKQVAQALLPIISDRIEAQAAEIERLRVEVKAQYDRGYYDGCTHPLEQSK